MASLIRRCTALRARSTADSARRARPPRPLARASSGAIVSISSRARSAPAGVAARLGLLDAFPQRFETRAVGAERIRVEQLARVAAIGVIARAGELEDVDGDVRAFDQTCEILHAARGLETKRAARRRRSRSTRPRRSSRTRGRASRRASRFSVACRGSDAWGGADRSTPTSSGSPTSAAPRTRVDEQRARPLGFAAAADEQIAELEAHARSHRTPAHGFDGEERAFVQAVAPIPVAREPRQVGEQTGRRGLGDFAVEPVHVPARLVRQAAACRAARRALRRRSPKRPPRARRR